MRANEVFQLSFGEKVYGLEVYNDHSTDLIAVGLKNSIIIYQISNETDSEKFHHNVIQAVKFKLFLASKVPYSSSQFFSFSLSIF